MKRSKSIQAVIRRARAQGRAEAVTLLTRLCPDDGVDGLLGCSANGDSGDYSSYWDVDAVRKLLCADTELCDAIARLQGKDHWATYLEFDLKKAREELAQAKQTPLFTTRVDAARFQFIARDMLSELARRYGADADDDLGSVLKRLDAAIHELGGEDRALFAPQELQL